MVPRTATKRPSKQKVEEAIRVGEGNLTRVASLLGCSRPTLYAWVYQHGLERVAGIDLTRDAAAAKPVLPDQARYPRTMRLSEGLWRWVRVRGIETDRTASDIVEAALELLRAKVGAK